jgi:hypothetical protein
MKRMMILMEGIHKMMKNSPVTKMTMMITVALVAMMTMKMTRMMKKRKKLQRRGKLHLLKKATKVRSNRRKRNPSAVSMVLKKS